MDFDIEEREYMEHHPFLTLDDDTEITHSDIKIKDNGERYITIYFETPSEDRGFLSMDIKYPGGVPEHIEGYTEEDISRLMEHYNHAAHIAFEEALDAERNS